MPACGLWVAGEIGTEGATLPGWTDLCQGRREAPRRGDDSHVELAGMGGGAWKVLEVTLWESCLQQTECPLGHRGHYSSAAAPQGPFLLGCVALTRCWVPMAATAVRTPGMFTSSWFLSSWRIGPASAAHPWQGRHLLSSPLSLTPPV